MSHASLATRKREPPEPRIPLDASRFLPGEDQINKIIMNFAHERDAINARGHPPGGDKIRAGFVTTGRDVRDKVDMHTVEPKGELRP